MSDARKRKPWFLYIVRCSDTSLYTGITTDITRRVKEHNTKKGAFYTKNKTPVKLVYQEALIGRPAASKREAMVKRLTRKQKLMLIRRRLILTNKEKMITIVKNRT
ncbi:MAG: GIY-YIG nuclease family protein [Candidatus Omnitrophica bacterium]|nr:GIY-YIG nuclease family protein [Candidatus Omnitrophota bacterium]